jgi:probable HAF family extracellular repeat protein
MIHHQRSKITVLLAFVAVTTMSAQTFSVTTFTDLGQLGTQGSTATAVNASGQIAGYSYVSGPGDRSFRYSGGVMSDLGTLGGSLGFSYAWAINDSGEVAGRANYGGGLNFTAYRYSGGVMSDLGTLGGNNSQAEGINNAGQVVGHSYVTGNSAYHAFRYSGGVMSDLGTLGGTNSTAFGINTAGKVVGGADNTGNGSFSRLPLLRRHHDELGDAGRQLQRGL